MKTNITVERTITITMTEAERQWLHGVMQNPVTGDIFSEHSDDKEMREAFFEATTLPANL